MATTLYTLEGLLIGKTYRSRSRFFEGKIVSAEKRSDVWYGDNTEAYLIEIDTGMIKNKFATIAVKVGE